MPLLSLDRISVAFGHLPLLDDVSLQIEHQMANAEAATGRLRNATARLATSRAQLDVQIGALQEARTQLRRLFWFVPGI